jgi:hypothetical protein
MNAATLTAAETIYWENDYVGFVEYDIIIPASVKFGSDGKATCEVGVDNVERMYESEEIGVSMTTDWELTSLQGESLKYEGKVKSYNSKIVSGIDFTFFADFDGYQKKQTAPLEFTITDEVEYAGVYVDAVTFNFSMRETGWFLSVHEDGEIQGTWLDLSYESAYISSNLRDLSGEELEEAVYDELGLKIGDWKEVEGGNFALPNAERAIARIIGFNHDVLTGGGGRKAGITFEFVAILDYHNMNDTNTNAGSWRDSEMREYLQNELFDALPGDLQAVIRDVDKITGDCYNPIPTGNITTSDKLFLLAEYEVFGYIEWSIPSEAYALQQYAFYTADSIAVKDDNWWWLRSPLYEDNIDFISVRDNGYLDADLASAELGVSPAFSI